MPTTPPEFAAAGLDHSAQLYQLTLQLKRLRGTVQRLWAWTGVLVFAAVVPTAYARMIRPPELVGRALVLEGSEARNYTIHPVAGGLGIHVGEKSGSAVADLLVKTEAGQVSIEKDGRVLWASP